MNEFTLRAVKIIRNQTGLGLMECKEAFDKTHSIKGAIDLLRTTFRNKYCLLRYDGQII